MRSIIPFRRTPFRSFFDDFFELMPTETFDFEGMRPAFTELKETDKELIARIEMPGIEKEKIEINVSDNGLEVKGMKREEKEHKDKESYSYSASSSGFYRFISLPQNTNAEKAEATYKDGVLEIRIPKKEIQEPKPKKIKVK